MNKEVGEALRAMPMGTHATLIYDSQENKRDVLFENLRLGAGKSGLVYAYTEESADQVESGLARKGLDIGPLKRSGTLAVLDANEVYLQDGDLDPPKVVKDFSELAISYRSRGFDGVRASAEMSCFFRRRKTERLLEYETLLQRGFAFPGIGICGYDLVEMGNSGHLEMLWPVLRAHALVIMTGPKGAFALEPELIDGEKVKKRAGLTIPNR